MPEYKIFDGENSRYLAEKICECMGVELGMFMDKVIRWGWHLLSIGA